MEPRENQPSRFVDLTGIRLEPHVKKAFETAWRRSGGEVITASDALFAVLEIADSVKSEAFSAFKSFCTSKVDFRHSDKKTIEALDFSALPLSEALADIFERIAPFLQKTNSMWGRDLITMALLLQLDSALEIFAVTVGSTLQTLRRQWFEFLTAHPAHRDAQQWRDWWEAAGVALPQAEPRERAFLLAWDPDRHPIESIRQNGALLMPDIMAFLSIAEVLDKSADMHQPQRILAMKTGEEPGLAGSGSVRFDAADPAEMTQSKAPDLVTPRPKIQWDYLFETPVLSLDALIAITGEKDRWPSIGRIGVLEQEALRKLDLAVSRALAERHIVLPEAYIQPDAPPAFSRRVSGMAAQDSLDVRQQAETFATLLVARYSRPPFAIGLLGDWGVGKTFFMRLMQESVDTLTAGGTVPERNANAVARVAQIEFNAWHYVDSDLWASLASHIFDELSKELSDTPDEILKVRRELRSMIHSSTREKQEAEAAIKNARTEREDAGASLSKKQTERSRLSGQLDKHRLKRIWQAVLTVKPDESDPQRRNWPDIAAMKTKVEATAKKLGIDQAIDNAEQLEQVYGQMRELCRRGSTLVMAVADDFSGRNLRRSIPVCVSLIGFVLLVQFLPDWLDLHSAAIRQWLAPVVQASTLAVSVAAWIAKRIKPIASAVSWLEQIREEVKKPRVMLPEPDEQENRLIKKLEAIDSEISKQQNRVIEADRQISKAQAEIQRINSGGLVYDFLEGRVRDGRYLDRLGLISVIRQDFEQLGKLLKDWSDHYTPDDAAQHPGEPRTDTNANPIERIILYIDDLDRCAPSRVVEVLQAVHLLLAFDLFIVIVAVDARWLERSLNETYNPALASKGGAPFYQSRHKFSAHNYLEKIFQIPFNLPVMQASGFTSLIDDMIAAPRQAKAAPATPSPKPKPTPETAKPGNGPAGDETHTETNPPDAVKKPEKPTQPQPADPPAPSKEATERMRKEQAAEQARKLVEAMVLSDHEKQFIHALYPFVPTPRLAKRFINIYRLLRVRATSIEETFSSFINPENGSYRAVLLLLAICVGRAESAPHLIRLLCDSTSTQPFGSWLDSVWSADSAAEAAQLMIQPAIGAVRKNLMENGTLTVDEDLEHYRKWGTEVGRYSFRWERLAPGTGNTATATEKTGPEPRTKR